MKKQDVISGILCVGLSLILYTQTFTSDAVIVFEDNINPTKEFVKWLIVNNL